MPTWPQGQTAGLVTAATFQAYSASFTAVNGQVALVTTGSSVITATLPPVAQGGPICLRKVDGAGTGSIKVVSADGSTVDGITGATGRTVAAASAIGGSTLVSDGTNWWTVAD